MKLSVENAATKSFPDQEIESYQTDCFELPSKSFLKRVEYLEDKLGLETAPPIFVRRIDHLELHILGENRNSDECILKRIDNLENALLTK